MKILIVWVAYCWVGLLHSTLVGTFIFAWFGHKINGNNKWLWALLIFAILFFFESYWIPMFNTLQIQVLINDPSLLSYFQINNSTNIVNKLTPGITTLISCGLQTILALYLGKIYKTKQLKHGK